MEIKAHGLLPLYSLDWIGLDCCPIRPTNSVEALKTHFDGLRNLTVQTAVQVVQD